MMKRARETIKKYLKDSSVLPLSVGPPIVRPSKVAAGPRHKEPVYLWENGHLTQHKGPSHRLFGDIQPLKSYLLKF